MKTLKQLLQKALNKWKFKDNDTEKEFYSISPEEEIKLFTDTLKIWLTQKRQFKKIQGANYSSKMYIEGYNNAYDELLEEL